MNDTPDLFGDASVPSDAGSHRAGAARPVPFVLRLDDALRQALDRLARDARAELPAGTAHSQFVVDPAHPNVSACARAILADWLVRHGYVDAPTDSGAPADPADRADLPIAQRRVRLSVEMDAALREEARCAGVSVQRYLARIIEARGTSGVEAAAYARELDQRDQYLRLLIESNARLATLARGLRQALGDADGVAHGLSADEVRQVRDCVAAVRAHVAAVQTTLAACVPDTPRRKPQNR